MHLADDVVLMTSEHYGSIIKTLREAAHAVTEIGLFIMDADPESPLDYYTADARDELDASLFNSMHGYYRSGFSALRNILEYMTFALHLHFSNDTAVLDQWKKKETQIKFSDAGNKLSDRIADKTIGRALFLKGDDKTPKGLIRALHKELCKYVHGAPGSTDLDMRQSNGPIVVRAALNLWIKKYAETVIYLLFICAIAYSTVLEVQNEIFQNTMQNMIDLLEDEELKFKIISIANALPIQA